MAVGSFFPGLCGIERFLVYCANFKRFLFFDIKYEYYVTNDEFLQFPGMPGTSRLYSQCQKANRICLVLFLHFATIPLKKSALPPTAAEDAVGGSCFVIAGETLQPREDRREGRREPPWAGVWKDTLCGFPGRDRPR